MCYYFSMCFNLVLHQLLQKKNYPIARFARDVGITRSHLYRLLNGVNSPTLETVKLIVDTLDISLTEFISLIEKCEQLNKKSKGA